MRKIALSGRSGVGLYALVDDADYEWLSSYKWHNRRGYAARKLHLDDSDYRRGIQRAITMHQAIFGGLGLPFIDHRDGNGLNNQRSNLRFASRSQNMANRNVGKVNKSGFKGVIYHPGTQYHHKPWQPYVQANNKRYYCGYFATALEAAQAYNQMAVALHGEFARLNLV